MKKVIRLLALVLVIILLTTSAFAEPIKVMINNTQLPLPTDPIILQDRTLVPLRAIFEALGAKVEWDETTKTVTGIQDNKVIILQINNKIATINGIETALDVPATIVNGSTLIPVRFIAESLGAKVAWDNPTRSVLIESEILLKKDTYKVVRVIDGDTIIVDYNGNEERIRLIGVDSPESVHPEAAKNVPQGELASKFTKQQLENKEVVLEFDIQERDQYGRLLAYVWLGNAMFNKTLLQEGHAVVSTFPPNVKYVDEFIKDQALARDSKKGVWGMETPIIIDKTKKLVGPIGNPDTAMYKGSINSDKYHYLNYTHQGPISDTNLIYFESLQHAIDNGYKPCGICFK